MRRLILLLAIPFLMSVSCTKQDRELTIIDQESKIDSYLSSYFKDSTIVRRNGSNKVIIQKGPGTDSLYYGDSLYYYYAGYIFTSSPSSLFATNNEAVATESDFVLTNPNYNVEKILFSEKALIPGLVNGLYGSTTGEHSIIVFSAKYGYYNTRVYNIPKLSALIYEIWVQKVIKN